MKKKACKSCGREPVATSNIISGCGWFYSCLVCGIDSDECDTRKEALINWNHNN